MGIGSNKSIVEWLGRASAGATLLEVVVAITILGVALPAGVVLLNNSFQHYTQHQLQEQALRIAQQEIEEIKAYRDAHVFWYRTIKNAYGIPHMQGKFQIRYDIRQRKLGKGSVPMWAVQVWVEHPQLKMPIQLTIYFSQYVAQ